MIRVAQMLMAEVFKRQHPKAILGEIINKFKEDQIAPYSFYNIC